MWCNNNICNPQTSCTLRTSTVLAMRGAYCICKNLPAEAETTSTARTERDKQTNKQTNKRRGQERGNELAAWLIGISSGSLGLATHEPCHEEEGRACVRKCARFLVCSLECITLAATTLPMIRACPALSLPSDGRRGKCGILAGLMNANGKW